MRIAVVGSGIAGLSSAWLLQKEHEISLYEQDHRPGGHSYTVDIDYDGLPISVDTGFMVYNEKTYPNLVRMFDHLGVKTKPSSMSFSASIDDARIEYAGTNIGTIFAQKTNLLRPSYLRMLVDIVRFNRRGTRFVRECSSSDWTIGQFLDHMKASSAMRENYLYPMAGSIWSAPTTSIEHFPAISFLRFFANHGLMTVDSHPQWRTVDGGSVQYVDKICASLSKRVRLQSSVIDVRRDHDGVWIIDCRGRKEKYDAVVMATHTDQSLSVLSDADSDEQRILSSIGYQSNLAVLHRDPSFMPKRKSVWSSWNYRSSGTLEKDAGVSLTYWMNSLQGIDRAKPLFVTINPKRRPDPELTFKTVKFSHPVFDQRALEGQSAVTSIQGRRNTFYAGAWRGYGFHEDGLRSGIEVAKLFGIEPPWMDDDQIYPVTEKFSQVDTMPSIPDKAVASPDH